MYPDLLPQKRGRVGSKLELTQEIERNIAKLNKKTEGRLGIRELAVAYEEEYGIRMPKSTMHRYCFLIGMYNVDQKWFYVVPMKRNIRNYPEDVYPGDDTAQHKAHIPKIMFLAAIGKPHTSPDGTEFIGKVGIWSFVKNVEAARGSKNRPRGTLETKGANVDVDSFYNIIMVVKGGAAGLHQTEATCCQTYTDYNLP